MKASKVELGKSTYKRNSTLWAYIVFFTKLKLQGGGEGASTQMVKPQCMTNVDIANYWLY